MCLPNNASMEEVYKAQVECLRKVLAEKDKEIEELRYLLDQANGMLPKEFRLKEKEDENTTKTRNMGK